MIKKLQIKLVMITMGVLLLVFMVIFLTLNFFMQSSSTRQTEYLLAIVAEQDGFFIPEAQGNTPVDYPPEFPRGDKPDMAEWPNIIPDNMRGGRFFYVKVDGGGNVLDIQISMMFGFSESDAAYYAEKAITSGKQKGTVDNMQFLAAEKGYGRIIVFAEKSIETQMLTRLITASLWIVIVSAVLLLALSIWLSKWAVKPVQEAFDKQRRFTSDASHELKTPLTIIAANADVLENEIGENKRLGDIKEQSARMGQLISDLLSLAKTDENSAKIVMSELSFSQAALNTTLEFECRAFEEGKRLTYDIDGDILITGSEQQIRQLIAILIDNAIKHSDERGEIEVTLKRDGSRARLDVYNSGERIAEGEREKIFDRFYRTDVSRSRETGGYGLGLAIAKSIASAHRGKIFVSQREGKIGGVCFTVIL